MFPGVHGTLFCIQTDSPSSESPQQLGSMKWKPSLLKLNSLFSPCPPTPVSKAMNAPDWIRERQGYKRGFISQGIILPQKDMVSVPAIIWVPSLGIWNWHYEISLSWGWPLEWKKYQNFRKRKLTNLVSIRFWEETRSSSPPNFHFLKCGMAIFHHVDECQIKLTEDGWAWHLGTW